MSDTDLRSAIEIARLLAALAHKYGGPDRVLVLTPEDMKHPKGSLTRAYSEDGSLAIKLNTSDKKDMETQ